MCVFPWHVYIGHTSSTQLTVTILMCKWLHRLLWYAKEIFAEFSLFVILKKLFTATRHKRCKKLCFQMVVLYALLLIKPCRILYILCYQCVHFHEYLAIIHVLWSITNQDIIVIVLCMHGILSYLECKFLRLWPSIIICQHDLLLIGQL
jgi:hypothetical protein